MFEISIKDRNQLLNSQLHYLVSKDVLPPGFDFYWADTFQSPGDTPWSVQMVEDYVNGPHNGMYLFL